MHRFVGQDQISKLLEQQKSDMRNPPRLLLSSEECARQAWITPAWLSVSLNVFSFCERRPDLNCFRATDAFLSRRNETLRMSRCALKMAAAAAAACLPGGFTHQQHRAREGPGARREHTRGANKHMHEQTCANKLPETCRHTHTILNLLCPNHKREMSPNWKDALDNNMNDVVIQSQFLLQTYLIL